MTTCRQIFEDAKHLLVTGDVPESIKAFTNAINCGERSDLAYLSRGVAYLKDHQGKKAIDDFTEVVKMNDCNMRAHYYRGIAYMTIDDYKDAITDFDKTIELDPENGAAFFARGTAYANLGNDELAKKNIKTGITYTEASLYGLQESIGLIRTQFDRTMSLIEGTSTPLGMTLSEEEVNKLKKWVNEGYDYKRDS